MSWWYFLFRKVGLIVVKQNAKNGKEKLGLEKVDERILLKTIRR